jgi:hypothetical protein
MRIINDSAALLLESLDEPLEHADPDLVLADLVLDAVLEIGVVVDLHDDEAAVGLLDVDAVEPLPDRPRRAHRDVDQCGRRLVDLEGAKAALARGAVGAMLDDLPVAARHAVPAHEQQLAREHADAPVELGRQEFGWRDSQGSGLTTVKASALAERESFYPPFPLAVRRPLRNWLPS